MRIIDSESRSKTVRDKGAAMVEFALVLPLLIILIMGVIEFGRAYNMTISLQGGAREGARALALCGTTDPCVNVDTVVNNSMTVVGATIAKTFCTVDGGMATVKVSKPFTFGVPFLPTSLGTITLAGKASMRCGL